MVLGLATQVGSRMAEQLGARKNGEFKAVSTAPSFNKTPVGSSIPPLPYPVTQNLGSAVGTAGSVQFNGEPAYVLDASTQPSCKGDAAGSAKGVKSGTVSGEVKPVRGSSTVRVEGNPIIRVGDPCTLNGGNCPGVYTGPVSSAPKATAAEVPPSANPAVQPETAEEAGWWGKASPWVHGVLGVASFVPGLSVVTGAADAAIYAAEGNAIEAGLAAASMIPGGKVATTLGKAGKAAVTAIKGADEAADVAKAAKAARAAKAAKEGEEQAAAATAKSRDGAKIKGTRSQKTGKCGEWLAKMDMAKEGFDEVIEVQNNSGHGVDLIGRNSKTGEVKVWEVKATETARAPSLSQGQAALGGERFTADRIGKAARGEKNYGKSPDAMRNAKAVKGWLDDAKDVGAKVSHERREVFIDDIDKGCSKHPKRPSRSLPWPAK